MKTILIRTLAITLTLSFTGCMTGTVCQSRGTAHDSTGHQIVNTDSAMALQISKDTTKNLHPAQHHFGK